MFEAALLPELAGLEHDLRVRVLALTADVDLAWLERCVSERPSFLDKAGASAARVLDASRRRRLMRLAADLYTGASTGDLDDLPRLVEAVSDAC